MQKRGEEEKIKIDLEFLQIMSPFFPPLLNFWEHLLLLHPEEDDGCYSWGWSEHFLSLNPCSPSHLLFNFLFCSFKKVVANLQSFLLLIQFPKSLSISYSLQLQLPSNFTLSRTFKSICSARLPFPPLTVGGSHFRDRIKSFRRSDKENEKGIPVILYKRIKIIN